MKNAIASSLTLLALVAPGVALAGFDFNPSSDHAGSAEVAMEDGCCDRMITEVVCHGNRDAGLAITIYSGGFAGITTAIISDITIAGKLPLGTIVVSRDERTKGMVAYRGNKFILLINTAEERDGFSPASVKTKIKSRTVAEDLVCRVQ